MIRIEYCPRCRATDQNCPACGEPVRALRSAQLDRPVCAHCNRPTAVYYSPSQTALRYDQPGLFYLACPVAAGEMRPGGTFDSSFSHTSEVISVSNAITRQRIAIKLAAEADGVVKARLRSRFADSKKLGK